MPVRAGMVQMVGIHLPRSGPSSVLVVNRCEDLIATFPVTSGRERKSRRLVPVTPKGRSVGAALVSKEGIR